MSRPASVVLSHLRHGRSVARTLSAFAVAAALTLVVGCSQDLTEPAPVRPTAAAAKPLFSLNGASVWNGRIVSIKSLQVNSANQVVCLDIPWGVAFSGQVVNYFPCHFGPAQQFVITAWDNPSGVGVLAMIRPVSSNSVCFDMRGGTTNGGEHLQLFTCKPQNSAGAANQIFKLPPAMVAGNATLFTTICSSAAANLPLETPLPMTASSFVQQHHGLTGANNQLWIIRDAQTGDVLRAADPAGSIWGTC